MSDVRVALLSVDTARFSVASLRPTLDGFKSLVGGWLEAVRLPGHPGLWLYVNEEGRLMGLPTNAEASRLAGQLIVGPAVAVRMDDEGNEVSLTDDDLKVLGDA
ncbi:MAG: DUF3846 domain-containing protein [Thermoplasmata archaeon]|nr:DUF3846 domain-containing protein [Thermoplasmata archaeon]